jgi:hypothetical protein
MKMIATNPRTKYDSTHRKQNTATRDDRHTFALFSPMARAAISNSESAIRIMRKSKKTNTGNSV